MNPCDGLRVQVRQFCLFRSFVPQQLLTDLQLAAKYTQPGQIDPHIFPKPPRFQLESCWNSIVLVTMDAHSASCGAHS